MTKQGETVWFQLRALRPHIESIAESLAKLAVLLEAESNQAEPERMETPTGFRVEPETE